MIFWPSYTWYFDPFTHGISNPYPWDFDPYTRYFDPSTHGITNPLLMVYRSPINGILTPLSIIFDPPTHGTPTPHSWYFDPPYMVIWPLPMVFWPLYTLYFYPYPWDFYLLPIIYRPPNHGIKTPQAWYSYSLCMVFWLSTDRVSIR